MAQSYSTSPNVSDRMQAMQLGKASIRVSAAGIFVGIIILFIYMILYFSAFNSHRWCVSYPVPTSTLIEVVASKTFSPYTISLAYRCRRSECQGPISTPLAEAAMSVLTGAERWYAQRGGGAHMIAIGGWQPMGIIWAPPRALRPAALCPLALTSLPPPRVCLLVPDSEIIRIVKTSVGLE